MSSRFPRYALLIALAILVAIVFWWSVQPPPLVIQGEVEATRIDLAPRVSGRIKQIGAEVGSDVKAGDTLIVLDSPQLEAGLLAAEAALAVAKADRDRIYGTRPETIQARRAELERTQSAVVLAEQVYTRQRQLLQSGNISQQRMDEVTNSLHAAQRARDVAQADLALAQKGTSDEDKALAEARMKQSEAVLQQTVADVAELVIRAPINGQVTTRIAEIGQLFSPGAPLLSLVDLSDVWLTFNIREDLLAGLKVGDTFDVHIPALPGRPVSVRVTAINAQGQYANWRATKATGDFDLRTFEVRAKPVTPAEQLRPGMSGTVVWSRATQRMVRG